MEVFFVSFYTLHVKSLGLIKVFTVSGISQAQLEVTVSQCDCGSLLFK